jgi:hypothetical protein
MTSTAEQRVSRLLRTILANLPNNADIADAEHFRDVLNALDWFIPEVLQELHPEWKYESLDGILPVVARKIAEGEAEIFGQCILISDQTLTPIHLLLQTSACGDEISWLELKLGESGEHGMVRTPYSSPSASIKRVYSLSEERLELIEWAYKVTFGNRRP